MSRALFTQNLDHAVRLADPARYAHWREQAAHAVATIAAHPQAEIAAITAVNERTQDLPEIEEIATEIAEHYSTLAIVGMGGSSLSGETLASLRKEGGLTLHFIDNIDPHSIALLLETLPWATTHFLVISKSGSTIETQALLALLLREAKRRIARRYETHFTFITMPNANPLHRVATAHGIRVLAHDADLCGRFSILSAVGLLPAAAVGVDIRALRAGASIVQAENFAAPLAAAGEAAALHATLMEQGISQQVVMHYCDRLYGFAAWHRQCWSESLGKAGHGTTPIPSRGATDQHSQLQLYLGGKADKLYTSLMLDHSGMGPEIGMDGEDSSVEYLKGHTLGDLMMAEQRATNDTLVAAGRPLRVLQLRALDETVLGGLLMHITIEIAFTAALLEINAFDQPAVEAGKRIALQYLRG